MIWNSLLSPKKNPNLAISANQKNNQQVNNQKGTTLDIMGESQEGNGVDESTIEVTFLYKMCSLLS